MFNLHNVSNIIFLIIFMFDFLFYINQTMTYEVPMYTSSHLVGLNIE
jgi:hypothetical protein